MKAAFLGEIVGGFAKQNRRRRQRKPQSPREKFVFTLKWDSYTYTLYTTSSKKSNTLFIFVTKMLKFSD